MAKVPFEVKSTLAEFEGVNLGDARLNQRLRKTVERLDVDPARSFPEAMVTSADLEGSYRFLGNRRVSAAAILKPHVDCTANRARACRTVLALHDTTEMRFEGAKARAGLGSLMNGGQGFYLHAALLVGFSDDAERAIPLGVFGHEILVRKDKPKVPWREQYADPDKGSLRWNRVQRQVEMDGRAAGLRLVHVADREASRYDLIGELSQMEGAFVIRVRRGFLDRTVVHSEVAGTLRRVVDISSRLTRGGRRKPKNPRDARVATLKFSAQKVTLLRPEHVDKKLPQQVGVRVVKVTEVEPPPGTAPIEWTLVTSEPVDTLQQIERVVDQYRARWLIEEFFKSLKTGCSYEDRQLESLGTLERALAISLPLAWHMLLLRNIGRDMAQTPARQVVGAGLYKLMLAIVSTPLNQWGFRLSASPDAEELLLAVARVGGHLPNNGTPGFITIRRGLDKLYEMHSLLALAGVEM